MRLFLWVVSVLCVLVEPVSAQLQPSWQPATTRDGVSAQQLLQSDSRLSRIVTFVNNTYRLPRPLPVSYEETGKVNAWYSPQAHEITISYDLVTFLRAYFRSKGVAQPDQAACDTLVFVLLHELGHALIHELDLPTVGREEDTADEFASLVALEALGDGGRQAALVAAHWFNLLGSSQLSLQKMPFWDEHALDSQRFYRILCLLYGADPEATSAVVTPLVPYTRLRAAAERYPQRAANWSRLLSGHRIGVAPLPLHPVLPNPQEPRTVHFEAESAPGTLQAVSELSRVQNLQKTVVWLNHKFTPPKHLYARYLSTDVPVNMFLPMTGQMVLSRSFFASAESKLATLPPQQKAETLRALETFSVLCEFSRGLIHDAQLPITGEPEVAAAELATMLVLQNPEFRDLALPMSRWYQALSQETVNVLGLKFWSESALSQQQYYDLQGYLYIADPARYPQAKTMFEPARLRKLKFEYHQKQRNWARLLQPFMAP